MMYKKVNIKLVSFFLILLFLFGCVVGCDNSKNSESEYSQNEDCQHEHTKWVTITDATFDNEGLKQLQCTKCKEVLKEEVIEELYLTQEEIKKKLNSSVIKVLCYDYDGVTKLAQGSGFYIDKNGKFITNAHVVEDCYFVTIKNSLGSTYNVDIMYKYDYTNSDYAILKSKELLTSAVEFSETANVGDTVYALGYPNDSINIKVTSGEITSTNTVEGNKHYYSNTALIDHGSSGGILADDKGRVLGITTGQFDDGEYAALKYDDFKDDVKKFHVGTKSPLEYFHTKHDITLNSYNIEDYLDISVRYTLTSNTQVKYYVTAELKNAYLFKKMTLDGILNFSIKIKTYYRYKEDLLYGTFNREKTDDTYLYFTFTNLSSLIIGSTSYGTSSIYMSTLGSYYGMQRSYELDVSYCYGSITIYDLYK